MDAVDISLSFCLVFIRSKIYEYSTIFGLLVSLGIGVAVC